MLEPDMDPMRRMISLIAHRGQDAALSQALGVTLPDTPRQILHDDVRYLWAGPHAWLAMADDPVLLDRLFVRADLAAVSEQGDGHRLFRIDGPAMRATLAKLLPIDISETAFPVDAVALTLAGHIGVKLWREDGGFVLACFRSFGASLHHALVMAGESL